ncbi:uncharacterized protein NESG_02198 [Nematocida ausubeli]|uniref:Rab-GAP TBC domain-containing protein n=1 Tax=Nematocida ausubeli (strain ATCC PRA-371 / ERTm2) TaxID=1913371 RepID=A0A086IZV6_NEMA1|nr:uncharacterized protein NESG_02198 [Nematocida ausubeli]KAI5138127.1 TBC1 domain family member 13 [Nematocida ausubeli]KAI5150835.1 TBC1 domain family member 13 [Nematocida ausubeli]KFG25424.1 hypothetical protein NESG_02198 [Nematocida ausubeli]
MKAIRERWLSLLMPPEELSAEKIASNDRVYKEYLEEIFVPLEVVDLIYKDVERTKIIPTNGLSSNYLNTTRDYEKVSEIIARILKVFAYTNRSIGYVQGMNIICSIVYYVISYDEQPYSESLAYFCFFNLMVDIGDCFSEKMDITETGIFGQQRVILRILRKKDPSLCACIQKKNLFGKSAFHIRWMVLLFSAEFELKDTLAVWERFFQERPRRKMVPYFCAAVLVILREIIIKQDEIRVIGTLEVAKINPYEALAIAEEFLRDIPHATSG